MRKIWILFFILIILTSLFKPLIGDFEFASLFFVLIDFSLSLLILLQFKTKFKYIFILGFILRVFVIFWDIYFKNIFSLPNSGADSEGYYYYAIQISNYESFTDFFTRGGIYSFINGILFYLIGPQRMVGQYLNVLFGLNMIILTKKIFDLLNISEKNKFYSILIISLFPNSLIMSGIFLRESIISFLTTLSLYYFTLWFKNGKNRFLFYNVITILLASLFHSGMLSLLFGFIFPFLFYSSERKKFYFTKRTIMTFGFFIFVFFIIYFRFSDIFLMKFNGIEQIGDYYNTINLRLGGSAYLRNLRIDSPLLLFLFGPIKFIYFYISPLPFDWRNIFDLITFFLDAFLYLIIIIEIFYFLIKNKSFYLEKEYIISLILVILITAIIFGSGVGNTGSALRHRYKFVSIFIILFGLLSKDNKLVRKEI